MSGHQGQYVIMIPEKKLIITRLRGGMVYTADSKSAALRLVGSNPTEATILK